MTEADRYLAQLRACGAQPVTPEVTEQRLPVREIATNVVGGLVYMTLAFLPFVVVVAIVLGGLKS